MKHLILTAGLLAAVLPVSAAAQCPQTEVARALAEAEPLGHYAQLVVDRIDEGIAEAQSRGEVAGIAKLFDLHFLSQIQSIFFLLVDTDLRSVEYERNLTSINSCLHYDLAILEAKIEEIRCETLEAYNRESPGGIRALRSLAGFANQRYKHLVKGALEPEHEDRSWQYYYDFDEPFEGWCCIVDDLECQVRTADECIGGDEATSSFYPTRNECVTESHCVFAEDTATDPEHAIQCPFDSDYLAASKNGYGCDLTVLQRIQDGIIEGVDAERDALENLADERDRFLEDIDHIKDTTEAMDNFVGGTMLSDNEREQLERFGDTVSDEDHKRVYGCQADLTPEERRDLESSPSTEENRGTEGDLTPEVRPSQEWVRMPLRGAFFFRKDHIEIWRSFFRRQIEWAKLREYPDYLKHPDEFPEEDDRHEAMEDDSIFRRLLQLPIDYVRRNWESIHIGIAMQESSILPKAQDMSEQVRNALEPVRPAMRRNVLLVNSSSRGLRKFGINFAYYLRRSCIYRPCNQKLDTVMQILFSDECFPYATGADGDWEACQDAVRNLQN